MKKRFLNFGLMGAIALASSVGFTACSDDKDDPVNNEDVSMTEVKESIPVKFVLSVSTGDQATTRMTAGNVQANGSSFRGISDAHLYSFAQTNDGKHLAAPATASNLFDFSILYSSTAISDNTTTSNRIMEMSLPVNTNTMVFYGKAPKTATNNDYTGVSASGQQGDVTANWDNNLNNITFTTGVRMKDYDNYQLNQHFFSAILSRIAISALSGDDKTVSGSGTVPVAKDTYPIVSGTAQADYKLFWADYVKTVTAGTPYTVSYQMSPYDNSKAMKALEQTMADTYYEYTTIYSDEIRGGASSSIKRVIADLWTSMNKVIAATPTDAAEAVARRMAQKIVSNIETFFTTTSSTGIISDTQINLRDVSIIQTRLRDFYNANGDGTTNDIPESYFGGLITNHYDMDDFPFSFGVPAGAAELRVVDNHLTNTEDESYTWFQRLVDNDGSTSLGRTLKSIGYLINLNPSAMGSAPAITAQNYIYPAELCYFGNSPLRVSNETLTKDHFPDGSGNWNTGGSDNLWAANGWQADGHVTSSTKSVAMKYNINYGTALMKTTVMYNAATIKDNNEAIQARNGREEADKTFDVSSSSPFTLTGIVIGGQPRQVGWNFLPKNSTDFLYYIYDKDFLGALTAGDKDAEVPKYTAGGSKSNPLYTMLWDNYNPGGDQLPVYVAVEFRNDGADFWGRDNLIRSGGTFYIIGELKPTAYSDTNKSGYNTDLTWPDAATTAYPPYNTDGTTNQVKRVFMQDYTTDVTFAIGENSLKSAYMTLPDMRSGQMSLGLSVDIAWRNGLVYNGVVLGENNPGY